MNKKVLLVISVIFIMLFATNAFAEVIPTEVTLNKAIKISFNGDYQAFKNANGVAVYPISYNGTTYLPIRSISSLFKMGIRWEGSTQSIYLGEGDVDTVASEKVASVSSLTAEKINANINKDIKIYYNNKIQSFTDANGTAVFPVSYNGTTYLPVRAISNLFGANIDWDGANNTVILNGATPEPKSASREFSMGSWEGNTYKNSYLGIQFTKTNDWEVASDSEADAVTSQGIDVLEQEGYNREQLSKLTEQNIIRFFYVTNKNNGSNIQAYREKNLNGFTIEEYVAALKLQLEAMSTMQFKMKDYKTETIAGIEFGVQEVEAQYAGVTMRQAYYLTKIDNDFFYIIVTDTVGNLNLSSMIKAY